jgi:hypothetical protein
MAGIAIKPRSSRAMYLSALLCIRGLYKVSVLTSLDRERKDINLTLRESLLNSLALRSFKKENVSGRSRNKTTSTSNKAMKKWRTVQREQLPKEATRRFNKGT